ncbi:Uncharacterised protein [Mycobacteroides abscessus subsp. abscessus]|nr:Uncharacterised protein [Mycobacteroides abscessus subsp. abscessus]
MTVSRPRTTDTRPIAVAIFLPPLGLVMCSSYTENRRSGWGDS